MIFNKESGELKGYSYFIIDNDRNNWSHVKNLDNTDIVRDDGNDYIVSSGKYVIYISNSRNIIKFESNNLLFKKDKIYRFPQGKILDNGDIIVAADELGNKFNIMDVWHSVFYFIKEEDFLKAERHLKLKKLR